MSSYEDIIRKVFGYFLCIWILRNNLGRLVFSFLVKNLVQLLFYITIIFYYICYKGINNLDLLLELNYKFYMSDDILWISKLRILCQNSLNNNDWLNYWFTLQQVFNTSDYEGNPNLFAILLFQYFCDTSNWLLHHFITHHICHFVLKQFPEYRQSI